RLVHTHHTWRARSQIYEWYILNRSLSREHKIVQLGPFDHLTSLHRNDCAGIHQFHCNSIYLQILREAEEKLQTRNTSRAEQLYLQCLNYHPSTPEPYLGIVRCALINGEAHRALDWMSRLFRETYDRVAIEPDPVEWAY